MFDAISGTYDFLNHLLSLNIDKSWRGKAVRALDVRPGGLYADLCTGTGDMAFLALRDGSRVVGVDFSGGMLHLARKKAGPASALFLVCGDAMALPLAGGLFDGASVAFGVRNFEDLDRGLSEMARLLKPGGRAVILEFSQPGRSLFGLLYGFYFRVLLPLVGRLVSRKPGAYAYLPASVESFPKPGEVERKLAAVGLHPAMRESLTGGAVTLFVAERTVGSGASV
jgi:demethylmenaquinone methyltransferase / 2-methoxy-6-polyprenyl-1,4-benzoquinol methylase